MPRLTAEFGQADLFCKRDDCTGLAFGGNKARQLEFHFGAARAINATTVLITGAVQSNYVRTVTAAAARLGLECEIQLERRVDGMPDSYERTGNVLLGRLFGARTHRYPVGEDEDGADRALDEHALRVKRDGGTPYVIHLGPDHSPVGSLGYVEAALELLDDFQRMGRDLHDVVVASGSAATHAGLLVGLKGVGHPARVLGMCVRRPARDQKSRVMQTVRAVEELVGLHGAVTEEDVLVHDEWFGGRYGHPDDTTVEALKLAARLEGLVLDPVYTAKSFAGVIGLARRGDLPKGRNVAYIHTGGTPALFAYEHLLGSALDD